jgi:hypothetical protein
MPQLSHAESLLVTFAWIRGINKIEINPTIAQKIQILVKVVLVMLEVRLAMESSDPAIAVAIITPKESDI